MKEEPLDDGPYPGLQHQQVLIMLIALACEGDQVTACHHRQKPSETLALGRAERVACSYQLCLLPHVSWLPLDIACYYYN